MSALFPAAAATRQRRYSLDAAVGLLALISVGCVSAAAWEPQEVHSQPRQIAGSVSVTGGNEKTTGGRLIKVAFTPPQRCTTISTVQKSTTTHRFSAGRYAWTAVKTAVAFGALGYWMCSSRDKDAIRDETGEDPSSNGECTEFITTFATGGTLFIMLYKGAYPGPRPASKSSERVVATREDCRQSCSAQGRPVYLEYQNRRLLLGSLDWNGELHINPETLVKTYPQLRREPLTTLLAAFTRVDSNGCQ